MKLNCKPEVSDRNDKWEVEEEVSPVSFPCIVENCKKLAELNEEGVKDPEESEASPVGLVIVEEVEEERLNVRSDVGKWQTHVEEKKLAQLEFLHFRIALFLIEFS